MYYGRVQYKVCGRIFEKSFESIIPGEVISKQLSETWSGKELHKFPKGQVLHHALQQPTRAAHGYYVRNSLSLINSSEFRTVHNILTNAFQ